MKRKKMPKFEAGDVIITCNDNYNFFFLYYGFKADITFNIIEIIKHEAEFFYCILNCDKRHNYSTENIDLYFELEPNYLKLKRLKGMLKDE